MCTILPGIPMMYNYKAGQNPGFSNKINIGTQGHSLYFQYNPGKSGMVGRYGPYYDFVANYVVI